MPKGVGVRVPSSAPMLLKAKYSRRVAAIVLNIAAACDKRRRKCDRVRLSASIEGWLKGRKVKRLAAQARVVEMKGCCRSSAGLAA